ncbi:MAG: tetratricopeptide repeat protein [Acidobacteria bacterium]|nr:tetratricopeptide repeat protein [Acidobacteriota bacterium]
MSSLFSNEIEAEIRAQLERLLRSRQFSASDRQTRLLRYLVEETLAGRGAGLKESVVGVEVFGKAIDYDPKTDSTVRSEVVKLRARLAEYYGSENAAADPWEVRVPKGAYAPQFERRQVTPLSPEPPASVEKSSRRWMMVAAVGVMVAAVLLFLRVGGIAKERRSLAVLPFRFLNANPEHDYLGVGLADALITRLTNQQKIIIRPTSRVLPYGKSDPVKAGRDLKTDYVLEGTVRTESGRLRLNVQLIDTSNGTPMWGATFDENLTDLLRVEDSLSRQVAEALQTHLSAAERDRVGVPLTTAPEALRLYLRGRYHYTRFTEQGARQALDLFRQAVKLDARFAHAWAASAEVILNWCTYHWNPSMLPEARAAAQHAVELDPASAEARVSLGIVKWFHDWDWAGAELEFRKAIELNPSYPHAFDWYGQYLSQMGRYTESRRYFARAIELDPDDLVVRVNLGLVSFYEGKYEQAAREQDAVLASDPSYLPALHEAARSWDLAGQSAKARAYLERSMAMEDLPWVRLLIARTYANGGDAATAREKLSAVLNDTTRYVSPAMVAMVYDALGDKERGLDQLEKAVAERSSWVTFFRVDPSFRKLREHPRFHQIASKAGL